MRTSFYFNYFILFIVFFIFYSIIHPIIPFSTDDWMNMTIDRSFYPSLEYWNPTKVFPECLEPVATMIAAYIITPIIGDYLNSLISINAFVVSFFIIIYLYSLHRLLSYKFHLSDLTCFSLVSLFIFFHFLILRISRIDNDYLLHSDDANCFYHYTIPNLLCASLVMWLIRVDNININNNKTLCFTILISYLALFSNLYSSVILIAFSGSTLLINLVKYFKEKTSLNIYVKNNAYHLLIIVVWIFIQILEVNGIRANSYGHLNQPFIKDLCSTLNLFFHIKINYTFIYLSITFIIISIIYYYKNNNSFIIKSYNKTIIIVLSLILTNIYIILLSSRVKPENIQKGDIIFSLSFYYLLATILCLGYLCSYLNKLKTIIPLLLFFVFFQIQTKDNTFRDVLHDYGYNAKRLEIIDRDIIEQICRADEQGNKEPIIYIPKFIRPGKYPLSQDCSEHIGITLYKHNITKNLILNSFEPKDNI